MVIIEELQSISTALVQIPGIAEFTNHREAKAIDETINNIIKRLDAVVTALNLDATANDLRLLGELRTLMKKKWEVWHAGAVDFGRDTFHWRSRSLEQEYETLWNRVREINQELFGDYAVEV